MNERDAIKLLAQMPHCDQRVLHAPGSCEYCDAHPQWQALRVAWGINFTGERVEGRSPCPSELRRPVETIEKWGGNRPKPPKPSDLLEGVPPPPPPVDRSKRATLHGMDPDGPEHREIGPDGMQRDYVVLSSEERAKGFVRPVRRTYKHLKCGSTTTMGLALAETYARDPGFYSGTFCVTCRDHFPVGEDGEFVWDGTSEKVGS